MVIDSHIAQPPDKGVAAIDTATITQKTGLASATLADVRAASPPGNAIPPQFGHAQLVDYAPRSTTAGDRRLPAVPSDAHPTGRPPVDSSAATTRNISDAWQCLNGAKTPEEKEAALRKFGAAVTAADQVFTNAEQAVGNAVDKMASAYPGVGPHDFTQAKSAQDTAFHSLAAASAKLTPEQRDEIGPEVDRWSHREKLSSAERQKIEHEVGGKYPELAQAMHGVREVQERYASFYSHGDDIEAKLRGTGTAREDRSAFQSRLDARQALSFALRSLGRNAEANAVDAQAVSIRHHEAPSL